MPGVEFKESTLTAMVESLTVACPIDRKIVVSATTNPPQVYICAEGHVHVLIGEATMYGNVRLMVLQAYAIALSLAGKPETATPDASDLAAASRKVADELRERSSALVAHFLATMEAAPIQQEEDDAALQARFTLSNMFNRVVGQG